MLPRTRKRMGLKSNKRKQPNSPKFSQVPETALCVLCNRPTSFYTSEKIGDLGEIQVLNSNNFLAGKDEKGNKVYAHAVCYGQQRG